jgi:hypothetical protein
MDRKTALFIFYSLAIIVIAFNILVFYFVIYKEQYYRDIYYLFGTIFFILVGYFWEQITSYLYIHNKLFWSVFTFGYFIYYLGKEKMVPQLSNFLLAGMYTYLVVALKGLYEFFKKGYYKNQD